MIMIKLCKLILNKFTCKKDIQYRYRSLVNRIFVEKMKNNQVNVSEDFLQLDF